MFDKSSFLCYNHRMKLTEHKLYNTWATMRQRCYDSNRKDYYRYGARGIKVAPSWNISDGKATGFKNFLKDMGEKPEGYQLDRINNSLGYSPENCRWVTPQQNASNKRNTIKYRGETASNACRRLGGDKKLVRQRISRGWTLERAFMTPVETKFHPSKFILF